MPLRQSKSNPRQVLQGSENRPLRHIRELIAFSDVFDIAQTLAVEFSRHNSIAYIPRHIFTDSTRLFDAIS